jgi:4-hydroxy 2-oxovalerate aldolase
MGEKMVKQLVLVDVTLRDGGYVNNHSWSRPQALEIVASCERAGIPFSEVGYFRPRQHAARGESFPAACCPPDYLEALHAASPAVALTVMAHLRDVQTADYKLLADCGAGMVRLPAQAGQLADIAAHVSAAKEAGLRVAVNLIRVTELPEGEIARAAAIAAAAGADAFYIADSNGSMLPGDAARLTALACQAAAGTAVGFHGHDGLSLAFANTLAAREAGASYLDASLAGMGKGGGNLALELIIGYLRAREGAQVAMAPLAHTAASVLAPWKGEGIAARCEAIASGLLDLNLDGIQAARDAGDGGLVAVVDAA